MYSILPKSTTTVWLNTINTHTRADSPPEYAKLCQLSPMIPLTVEVIKFGVMESHEANVWEATVYPPRVTES